MLMNGIKINKLAVIECASIFLICTTVYLANRLTLGAGDSVPNSLLAFNLLENHTLHLDILKKSYLVSVIPSGTPFVPFGFIESFNGHLASIYPIGVAILTFPLYVIFYIYLKLIHIPVDLTSASFEVYRGGFEKLAATLTSAISVVLFYLSSRIKFSRKVALVSTFIFAFSTNTWITSSQALWQHGSSNLALVTTIFCLLKANHSSRINSKMWLILAGVFAGFLPGIRPTSLLFLIAAVVYSVFTYRYQSIFLFVGLASALPSLVYNLYYFGNLVGGYSQLSPISLYSFTLKQFLYGFLGTLLSPSRGLFIFSPILLYALPGAYQVFRLRSGKDEKLIGCMTVAAVLLFLNYCFYIIWWGGYSYGPRFLTDILPIVCYVINYCLVNVVKFLHQTRKLLIINSLILISLIIFSTMVQLVCAFGNGALYWNSIPLDTTSHQYRLWEINDSQIERSARALLNKICVSHVKGHRYVKRLNGIVKQVKNEANQLLISPVSITAGSTMILKANVENTGESEWYGYEYALDVGEVRVRLRFYDSNNQLMKDEGRLYASAMTKDHETTSMLGSIVFPREPGTYTLVFELIAEGVSEFPKIAGQLPYSLDVIVEQ